MSSDQQRMQMAQAIVEFEARRVHGHLSIYILPKADGGGAYEVAGINERFHPEEAAHLAQLINEGRYDDAERQACDYIAGFTDHVRVWTGVAAIESYLRDCSFNRGPRGSARILQMALHVEADGYVGPDTLAALRAAEPDPLALLGALRAARESYERNPVGRDESSIFWVGLVNRWNKALDFAKSFLPGGAHSDDHPGPLPGAGAMAMDVASTVAFAVSPTVSLAAPAAAAVHGNFYTDVICRDHRFTSTDRVADVALLEPRMRQAVQAIIADAAQLGITLMVFETYRSKQRQQALFDQGASKLRNVGVHHYGLACDLVKDIHGQPSWKGDFDFLGTLARHHGMVWGGDWGEPGVHHSFVDSDHVQQITKGRQASLFAGSWYPDDSYDPYHDGAR